MFEAVRLLVDALFGRVGHAEIHEDRKMREFLGQATNHAHLEALEREWFSKHHKVM